MSQDIILFDLHIDKGIAIDCKIDQTKPVVLLVGQLSSTTLYVDRDEQNILFIRQSQPFPSVEL